ncbi:MAG: 2-dehydropantoate 2-reductase [Variovorax sp.]
MNITILGAGAMGSFFGGMLAESGQDVTLLDINDAHLEAIRTGGLHLVTDRADRKILGFSACRPEQATVQPELLIVFTKTLHTAAALAGIMPIIGTKTFVLTVQNGLGNVETVSRFVAPERVLIGMTNWPADLLGPGQVSSHGQGEVRIMSADGVERPETARVAEALFAAGLQCRVDPAVWNAIWEKVAFNAALNSMCAVTGCTVDQLGSVPEGMSLIKAVISEVTTVAHANGVDARFEHCEQSVRKAIANHIGHKPSMLQDVLSGRRTEVGAINGAVVTQAGLTGIAVPNTEMLLGLVRLIEARTSVAA